MSTIIDRYLLRQFVQAFIICWLSLTGLYIVFDAFSNLDHFLRATEDGGSLLEFMGTFYAYRSVYFFDRTSAMLALVAAMFTVTWIQRHNELTAIMAAGISRRRVIKPLLGAAIAVNLIAAVSREAVIPRLREPLSQSPREQFGNAPQSLHPRYDQETSILIRGKDSVARERRIREPVFLLPTSLDPDGRQIAADDCVYQEAAGARPGGYWFRNVREPLDLLSGPNLRQSERVVIFTPRGEPNWLKPGECFIASNLSYEHLTGGNSWKQFSSTAELIRGLHDKSLDYGADVRVAVHSRIVQPFLDISLLVLGLPLVLVRDNRNMFVTIAQSSVLIGAFLGVTIVCQYLGSAYLMSPAVAAWIPVALFVPAAIAMYDRIER